MRDPKQLVKPDAIYMGDNGRLFCGNHAGASAAYTLRDISGQPVVEITEREAGEWHALGLVPKCETCDKGIAA